MFDEQVNRITEIRQFTPEELYEFIKSVYEFVIPDNKEPGERAFNVLDYYAMEEIGAYLKSMKG